MGMQHPCSRCGKRKPGKFANGYVAWYSGDDRTTFYTRWCTECFAMDVLPALQVVKAFGEQVDSLCVMCSEEIKGEPAQVFLTLFPPKRESVEYMFSACPEACYPSFRDSLAKGGKLLAERGSRVGAQAQAPTPQDDAWAEFNL